MVVSINKKGVVDKRKIVPAVKGLDELLSKPQRRPP
jgi:hypothetical protein